MRWVRAAATCLLVISVRAADASSDCPADAVAQTAAYTACKAATGIDFDGDGKTSLDAALFCGNADCRTVWDALVQTDALQCMQRYDAGEYKLKYEASARQCFAAKGVQSATAYSASTTSNATDESATISAVASSAPTTSDNTSTSTTTTAKNDGTSLSAVWIALGGCAVGVVLLVIVSVVIRRRKRTKEMEAKVLDCLEPTASPGYVRTLHSSRSVPSRHQSISSSASGLSLHSPMRFFWEDRAIKAARIPYGKITFSVLVSRGGFGEVYKGMYRNKMVAIKKLLPEKRNDMGQVENFFDEVKLMAALNHERIVRLVGVAWEALSEVVVLSEYMALGDLRSLLWKYEADDETYPRGFNAEKIKIALHVANAIHYMHSLRPVVLHRDVKSRNILLDKDRNAKVTDFGVSRERADSTMTMGVGSTLWMAPEVMTGGRYNEKADIFSFGVVLSELDTHTLPYSHAVEPVRGRKLPDTVIVQMMTLSRISVEFTNENASSMAQLGRRCINLDPSKRPSAEEVEQKILTLWQSVVLPN